MGIFYARFFMPFFLNMKGDDIPEYYKYRVVAVQLLYMKGDFCEKEN